MHKFQSKLSIFRLRLAAFLFLLKLIVAPVAVVTLVYSLWLEDRIFTLVSLGLINVAVFIMILQWFVARRANCPLCIAPVLANRTCVKHRNSRPLLGSHYLRVATSVLFKNQFRCPYCSETSELRVRVRKGR